MSPSSPASARRVPAETFHLLEITVISAQDLYPVNQSMQTYAVAWAHPDHKLRTRLDAAGHTDPSWNDKLVFRVDAAFLRSDTSTVTVEIFTARRLRSDALIGTARLVISNVQPTPVTRFAAIQVRRPRSLRPQGIINLGVALLDAHTRSQPLLYASAFAYKAEDEARSKPRHPRSGVLSPSERMPAMAPPPPPPHLTGSSGRTGAASVETRERSALERKLSKWRAELPALAQEGESDEDCREKRRPSDGGTSRRTKTRTSGKLSCCYSGELVEERGGGKGSHG